MFAARQFRWLALIAAVYAGVELLALAGLAALEKTRNIAYQPVDELSQEQRDVLQRLIDDEPTYVRYDRTLGWTLRQNAETPAGYRANADGIRADREYMPRTPPGKTRILTFGDSFTHCDDVSNDDTWQAAMQRVDPDLEVLNFGVGGYGPAQSHLRYLLAAPRYEHDYVFIGITSENVFRAVNVFRPFYSPATLVPLAKPRYTVRNGKLDPIQNPAQNIAVYQELLNDAHPVLERFGEHDYYYRRRYRRSRLDVSPLFRLIRVVTATRSAGSTVGRSAAQKRPESEVQTSTGSSSAQNPPSEVHTLTGSSSAEPIIKDDRLNERSEAFAVTTAILDEFYRSVVSRGGEPVVVIFPTEIDVLQFRESGTVRYAPLLDHLERSGHHYVDLMPLFGRGAATGNGPAAGVTTPGDGPAGDAATHGHTSAAEATPTGPLPMGELFQVHYTPQTNARVAAHLIETVLHR